MANHYSTYELRELIRRRWSKGPRVIDWLSLENTLDLILNSQSLPDDKVSLCKEALDAHTRRGHFQPEEYLG